jgi:hypothetical protein
VTEEGHHYSFGAPKRGWPRFGPDGKIIRDEPEQGDSGVETVEVEQGH